MSNLSTEDKQEVELLPTAPPWFVEVHDAKADYARVCLVSRCDPRTEGTYYVVASDDMESRRDQTIVDFKFIAATIVSHAALEAENTRLKGLLRDTAAKFRACAIHVGSDPDFVDAALGDVYDALGEK